MILTNEWIRNSKLKTPQAWDLELFMVPRACFSKYGSWLFDQVKIWIWWNSDFGGYCSSNQLNNLNLGYNVNQVSYLNFWWRDDPKFLLISKKIKNLRIYPTFEKNSKSIQTDYKLINFRGWNRSQSHRFGALQNR